MELLEDRQTRGFEAMGATAGLARRIFFLDPADQQLLEMTWRGRLSRREAAMLLGQSGGTVTRRIKRLKQRLNDPLVIALVESGQLLPELHREVGLAYHLRNWTMAKIGSEYELG